MPVIAVTDVSAHRCKHKNWNLIRKSENTQQRRRIRQLVYQPKLRGRLHPRPDQRDELPREKKLKIAMSQCAKARGHEEQAPSVVQCAQPEQITMTRENGSVNQVGTEDSAKLHYRPTRSRFRVLPMVVSTARSAGCPTLGRLLVGRLQRPAHMQMTQIP